MRAFGIVLSIIVTGFAIWYNLSVAVDGGADWKNFLVTLGYILFWIIFVSASKKSVGMRVYTTVFWDILLVLILISMFCLNTVPALFMLAPLEGFAFLLDNYLAKFIVEIVICIAFSLTALKKIK